ncbi:MAG: hypothetical protein KC417_17600, partial [Myxococcales bacterium]|nr:hypothetical protein [Myxococcales bacterium]
MLALSFFVGVGPVPRVAAQLAPTDAELAEAKEHYRTGTEHLKASEHAAALESFERSFALYASPN